MNWVNAKRNKFVSGGRPDIKMSIEECLFKILFIEQCSTKKKKKKKKKKIEVCSECFQCSFPLNTRTLVLTVPVIDKKAML